MSWVRTLIFFFFVLPNKHLFIDTKASIIKLGDARRKPQGSFPFFVFFFAIFYQPNHYWIIQSQNICNHATGPRHHPLLSTGGGFSTPVGVLLYLINNWTNFPSNESWTKKISCDNLRKPISNKEKVLFVHLYSLDNIN